MLLDHYSLREDPFQVNLDARFLYPSPTHHRAFRALREATLAGKVLQILVAESGLGKTMLLNALLEDLPGFSCSYVWETQWDVSELYRFILSGFGESCGERENARLRARLLKLTAERRKKGGGVLIVLDEAQNLPAPARAEIRCWVGQSSAAPQVILCGWPQLATDLERSDYDGSISRVMVKHSLEPLNAAETSDYIRHRLKMAGHQGPQIFDDEATRLIALAAAGIPRVINNICWSALRIGMARDSDRIDPKVAQEAIESLFPSERAQTGPPTADEAPDRSDPRFEGQSRERLRDRSVQAESSVTASHFARTVRNWLAGRASVWVGTAGELIAAWEQNAAAYTDDLPASPKAVLAELEAEAEALRELGVHVEFRTRAGSLKLVSLRYIPRTVEIKPNVQTPAETSARPIAELTLAPALDDVPAGNGQEKSAPVEAFGVHDESLSHIADVSESDLFSEKEGGNAWADFKVHAIVVLIAMALTGGIFYFFSGSLRLQAANPPGSLPPSDPLRAEKRAAELGDPNAQRRLALRYQKGDGVPQDDASALVWLRHASSLGDSESQYLLGKALAQRGSPEDKTEAYKWFVVSYAAGFKESLAELKALNSQLSADDIRNVRYSLGQMYREGRGSAPDRVAAYTWFTLAEAVGDRPSIERKRELKAQMAPQEIDMATRRANTWLKRKQQNGVPAAQP